MGSAVCQNRSRNEQNLPSLPDVARHATHSTKTLDVAIIVDDQDAHDQLSVRHLIQQRLFQLCLQMLNSLRTRSQPFDARLGHEVGLEWSAFKQHDAPS